MFSLFVFVPIRPVAFEHYTDIQWPVCLFTNYCLTFLIFLLYVNSMNHTEENDIFWHTDCGGFE